jgi:hypothetical protein
MVSHGRDEFLFKVVVDCEEDPHDRPRDRFFLGGLGKERHKLERAGLVRSWCVLGGWRLEVGGWGLGVGGCSLPDVGIWERRGTQSRKPQRQEPKQNLKAGSLNPKP